MNYLNNILAKIEGKHAGAEEVLMLNAEGYVVECSGDNIFWIKNEVLVTPPVHMGILEGVTRNSVIDLAREAGMQVEERVFTRHDLYIADECFLTGTAAEVIPVVKNRPARHWGWTTRKDNTKTYRYIQAVRK